jgi:hypothetical protein
VFLAATKYSTSEILSYQHRNTSAHIVLTGLFAPVHSDSLNNPANSEADTFNAFSKTTMQIYVSEAEITGNVVDALVLGAFAYSRKEIFVCD